MTKKQKRSHRGFTPLETKSLTGFTLIELVIVITILAILAAVAIPAFQNLTSQARNAGTQGAVGGLRSALAVYRANEISRGCDPATALNNDCWPPITVFNTVMENGTIPPNPWGQAAGLSSSASATVEACPDATTAASRGTDATGAGWRYWVGDGVANNGLVYANTAVNNGGACGGTATTENCF